MTELTDRYVSATLRSIPDRQRADIEAELRASIDDAIEARIDGGAALDAAEKDVLIDLGDPDRLAANYSERPAQLIGPELFFDYKRLLGVLLVTVVPIVMVVIAVLQIIAGEDAGTIFGEAFGIGLTLVVHIVFWTTLVFALIERSGERPPRGQWDVTKLPALPTTGSIKLGETIASVVFLTLAIAGMTLQRTISPVTTDDGAAIPLFDPDLWSFWLPFLIAVLILEIVFELVKYRVGRWTWALASVNLALGVLFAVPAIYLLTTERLFNTAFFEELGWAGAPEAGGALIVVTVISIVGITVWDIVDGFRKAASR